MDSHVQSHLSHGTVGSHRILMADLDIGTANRILPVATANRILMADLDITPPATGPTKLNSVPTVFHFSDIKENEVRKLLATLHGKKATGPDNISARLLRMVAPAISDSITSLLNTCLSLGEFPSEWKQANVTPVPKSGDMHLVKNFRPVSVIPVLENVFETVVHRQLHEYFESHGLLNPAQSGFHPFHNTQDVILKTIDDWKLAMDKGKIVGTTSVKRLILLIIPSFWPSSVHME